MSAGRRWAKEDGFTVTEIVVATFLVTVGLLSLAAVMTTMVNRQDLSESLTIMTNLGTSALEEINGSTYDAIVERTDDYGSIPQFADYRRAIVVTPNADDSLKTVAVTVTAASGQQVALETVMAR